MAVLNLSALADNKEFSQHT